MPRNVSDKKFDKIAKFLTILTNGGKVLEVNMAKRRSLDRLSVKHAEHFKKYFDLFIKFAPSRSFNIKQSYSKGFIEKKAANRIDSQKFYDSIKKELLKKPSKKKPQGADFAAERRKERLAKNDRMDEASKPPNATSDYLKKHPVKPEEMVKPISRKAQIVKSAAKKDKFIADPIINNTNVKADGDQR